MGFSPSTAIITGSDSGIGRAVAVALAKAGMDVGITWHQDQKGAQGSAQEVEAAGSRVAISRPDTTELDRCAAVVDSLAEELGGLDVFVNCAGTGDSTPFLELDLATWRRTVDTNLTGAFLCLQRAAQLMASNGRGGRIIAVTSVHETQPLVGSSAYDAAKHGLGGLVKTMAVELGALGITVNSVAPGEIATAMTGHEDIDPSTVSRKGIPLGRPGDAREVAAVVAFLASPAASYVTGASWPVDGGMLMMGPQAGPNIHSDDWRPAPSTG